MGHPPGGPFAEVTVPGGAAGGFLGGGATGWAAAMSNCMSGSGSGGGGGNSAQKFNKRDASHRKLTGEQIISRYKKGSIRSEFPSEYLGKTFNEIDREAGQGIDAAQTARKLLTDSRFDK